MTSFLNELFRAEVLTGSVARGGAMGHLHPQAATANH